MREWELDDSAVFLMEICPGKRSWCCSPEQAVPAAPVPGLGVCCVSQAALQSLSNSTTDYQDLKNMLLVFSVQIFTKA